MFILYDLIYLIILFFYLPPYLLKRKFHKGFVLRFGFLPKGLKFDNPIWIHAVSLGEMISIKVLLGQLRVAAANKQFVISTVTATGNKIAQTAAAPGDFVTYLPFDFSFIVRRVIDRIKPSVFVIAETEIWPNLISYLYARKIPVVVINGRISDSSFKGYRVIRLILKPLLNKISLFCVQSQQDRQRLIALGVCDVKIKVTGNLKFDSKIGSLEKEDHPGYRDKLAMAGNAKLFTAASTHPGEEEIILNTYKDLLKEFNSLVLLIAPRHPERSSQLAKIISGFGFRPVLVSEAKACGHCLTRPVFILDTIGQLIDFYNISDIVFVGGSLIKRGGHNILEPAILGKPVLFGPNMFNFRDISELFLKNNAAIMVADQEQLKVKAGFLLNNPGEAEKMSVAARELISKNRGATSRDIQEILSFFNKG